jgi:hypothetical protein
MKEGNGKPTKSSQLSQCSTAAMTRLTQASEDDHPLHSSAEMVEEPTNAVNLYAQAAVLAGVSAASFGTVVVLLLPFPVLIALSTFLISSLWMMYLLVHLIGRQYRSIVRGRGIGDYLPSWIYNQLTELTLHEWMQDTGFTREYRHLLLYFVPGITPEQLEAYLSGLSPRHQYNLHRHGLGHLCGEKFMRLIMGDSRYRTNLLESQLRPTELLLPPPSINRGLLLDADSDLGSSAPDASPVEIFRSSPGSPIEVINEVSTEIIVREETLTQLDHEGDVLTDAIYSMATTYVRSSIDAVYAGFVQVVESIAPWVIGTGLTMTTVSAGMGIFAIWYEVLIPGDVHYTSMRSRYPSSRMLLGTGIFGGVTAGTMLIVRSGLRVFLSNSRRIEKTPVNGEDLKDQEKNDGQ